MAQENIAKFVTDPDAIKKIIYVPGKILNVVAPPAEEVRRDARRPACHGIAASYIPRAQRRSRRATRCLLFPLLSFVLFYDARRAPPDDTTSRAFPFLLGRPRTSDGPTASWRLASVSDALLLARDGLSRPVVLDRRRGPCLVRARRTLHALGCLGVIRASTTS